MNLPRLQAIVDVDTAARAAWTPLDLARACRDGGARFLQLRAKRLASGHFLDLCDGVVAMADPYGASVIVNDRVDVARLAGAAGAHVGQEDLAPGAARAQLGAEAIVGYSTHTLAQVRSALEEPVSYIAVGPVFGTVTKATGYDAVGLALVREARRLAGERPLVAIGGITLETSPDVIRAGASSVAVISDLLAAGDPARRVRQYVDALARA